MSLAWFCAKPAWVNVFLATRWYSGSVSTLVSVEPGRMPRSSQMPELPQPVPISTAVLAPAAQARKRSAAPTAGDTGSVPPRSAALARAASSGSSSGRYSAVNASGPTRSSLAPSGAGPGTLRGARPLAIATPGRLGKPRRGPVRGRAGHNWRNERIQGTMVTGAALADPEGRLADEAGRGESAAARPAQ